MLRKFKKPLIYLLFAAVPFLFLFLRQDLFANLKTAVVASGLTPVRVVLFPFQEAKKILFYHQTYDEYQKLKKEVEPIKHHFLAQEDALKENARLKELLNFKRRSSFMSVAANVVMRDPTNWAAVLIIDRGSQHGIRQGMPVVTPLAVVGKIAEVGPRLSKVILLTDPRFSTAAAVERTREQGLISGTLRGTCRLQYLPVTADIQVGDSIVTSKLSTFFPPGLLIGRVVAIQESFTSPTLECLVKPVAALSRIEEVLVILSRE